MKKIRLLKGKVNDLFNFLEENKIDEYIHNIKKDGKTSYSLNIKKRGYLSLGWIGTFLVGIVILIKFIDNYEIIFTQPDWVLILISFGIFGILICSHFLIKFFMECFIYKYKFVRIDEAKKIDYNSNLE